MHNVAELPSCNIVPTPTGFFEFVECFFDLLGGEHGLLPQHLHVPGGEGAGLHVVTGLVVPHPLLLVD